MAERISALEKITAAAFRFRNRLDGRFYVLRFLYNTRFDYWTLEYQTTAGVVLRGGIKLLAREDTLGRFSDPDLPPGTLFVLDSEDQDLDPGRFDLGDRIRLVYTSEAELAEAG